MSPPLLLTPIRNYPVLKLQADALITPAEALSHATPRRLPFPELSFDSLLDVTYQRLLLGAGSLGALKPNTPCTGCIRGLGARSVGDINRNSTTRAAMGKQIKNHEIAFAVHNKNIYSDLKGTTIANPSPSFEILELCFPSLSQISPRSPGQC